jgi:hypothetical protein
MSSTCAGVTLSAVDPSSFAISDAYWSEATSIFTDTSLNLNNLVTIIGDTTSCPVTCNLITEDYSWHTLNGVNGILLYKSEYATKYCDEGNDVGSCTGFDATITEDR